VVLKKHLTPIGKGGIVKHEGKGAMPFPQPKPGPLTMGAPSANNYAKATPLPTPPPPMGGPPSALGPVAPMTTGSPGQSQGMV
jgi:hypothetical protein